MGYIKKLKNNELVGGTDKHTIYPVTSTEAVFEEITNGNESSFKSQKTINKEQQDELDDHEERIQAAEAEDIKSITINGSTKKFEVDDENNVDLTIYTVDSDPDMPDIADNVRDLRNMVGTSTPVLETSHKTRIDTLEGGESVTGSVENKIKTKVDSINSSYQDDNNEYVKYSMTQTSGEVTDFNIDETNLKNAITSLNTSISGDNIVIRSGSTPSGTGEAGKIYRYVNSSNNTYTDYMYSGGSWVPLATHDTSNEQAQVAYYTCTASGSGAQATKQFVGNGSLTYTPSSGGHIKILMGEANTATGTIYLQFGTTTSTKKPLYYNGESVSSDNTWEAGETIAVYYDPSANSNAGAYYASNAQGGGGKAEKIKYDNSQSGIAATDVQSALDEVANGYYADKEEILLDGDAGYSNIGFSIYQGQWKISASGTKNRQRCYVIEVNEGEYYELVGRTDTATSPYAWLVTANPVNGEAADYVSGTTTMGVNANDTVIVRVPSGAHYLYLTSVLNGTDRLVSKLSRVNTTKEVAIENKRLLSAVAQEVGLQPYYTNGEPIVIKKGKDGYTRYNIDIYNAAYRTGDDPRSIFIPIGNASEITITANSENLSSFALVTDVWDGVSTVIPFADGWSDRRTIPAGETGVIADMSNASYLCLVLLSKTQTDLTPASVIVTKTTSKIDLFENEIARIKTKEIAINDTELFEELDLHINSVYGGYIPSSTGVWVGNSFRHCIIPVKGGQKVQIKANEERASGIAFLQEAPALVNAAIYCDGTSYIALAAGEVSEIITVPDDAKYLYYTHSGTNYLDPSFVPSYIKITRPLASLNDASRIATKSASYSPLKPIKSENEMFTYGLSFYPQAILTHSDIMNRKLVYGWVNKNKGIGVSWMDMFGDTITQFQVGTAASVDDHNPCSVFELQDGRIAAIYTGGHNETTAMRIRITTNANDLTQWEDEFRVEIGVSISYAQVFYVNSYYYIFFRTKSGSNWGWSCIRSSDFETWESPVAWLSAGTVQYYTKMQKVKDYPNILRVAMYSNPAKEDPSIRLGYIDFSTGNIYNGEVSPSKIIGSLGGTAVNYTAFDVVIPKPGGSQRLFDVAYSNLADVKILFATIATSVYNNIRYSIYDNGVIRPMCHGGCGFYGGVYQGGAMFIDENTVVISRNTNDGKTFIPTGTQIDGDSSDQIEIWTWNGYNWKCACVKYSEPVMDGAHPLRNIRPIPCDGKFLMWIRGYYNNDAYTDFDTDAIVTWI